MFSSTKRSTRIGAQLILVAAALALLAMWVPLEEVPTDLPPLDGAFHPRSLELAPHAGQPGLRLRDLEGRRVFLWIVDARSALSMDGFHLRNSLMRWRYPEDVVGYEVVSLGGIAGRMTPLLAPMMASMQEMSRFPLVVDPDGAVASSFRLPAGHAGLVILDEQGRPLLRHSGVADQRRLAEVARLLRATEPPPPPAAPVGLVGSLTRDGAVTAILFLDEVVRESDIRGVGMFGMAAMLAHPSRRIVDQFDRRLELDSGVDVVVVGDLRGFADRDWSRVTDGERLRRAFQVADGEAGLVVIDAAGKQAFREVGRVPLWKLGLAAEALGAAPRPLWPSPAEVR